MPYNANDNEKKVLEFWKKDNTFQKSVEERDEKKPYVFYDGPPFATGLPHYGHIVASTMKDVVPRFWTMNGYRVERKWGWDCHGLPIENIIEKDLNLATKKDIEEYGIAKFNEACRSTVLQYAEDWKKVIERMGRWVDMENDYKTMDITFMESVWWVFKQLWDKGLVYEGKKAMHICPRCVTPLSNFEVTQGYKDIKDISATAKFKVEEKIKEKLGVREDVYILAWTTTPWTLPGNVLLAVGENIEYVCVKQEGNIYIIAKERVSSVMEGLDYEVVQEIQGKDLVGYRYEPLFPYFADTENAFRIVAGDFVTTEDGTGVVHIAPAFGEDDYAVGKKENVGFVQHVSMDGKFIDAVLDFAGMEVKPKDDHMSTDVEIIKWLAHNGKLFSKAKYEHSYPHCWRCDTPLLNYATSSWFIDVPKIREQLLKNNEKINWVPDHIKDGRFGKWLEGAREWAVSRTRYWGATLPIWKNEDGETLCIGSVEELEQLSGQKITDLHKHIVDEITFEKDGKKYTRVPEVFDCWFESGSMPYGQMHYPFENKEKFEAGFPAEFIAEGQDQTRGWFYTLHVLATALTLGDDPVIPKKESIGAFKNVIVNGMVLAEDGKKMSKRLKNYPDPNEIFEKYGADAMRFYLTSSPVMHAEALNFSEAGVREIYNKLINTLSNVLAFYEMFAGENTQKGELEIPQTKNILDQWILSLLQVMVRDVTLAMKEYKLAEATRPILDFVTELSQWYVRRSRDRFKGESTEDGKQALETLGYTLQTLAKVIAPVTPFIAESVYQSVVFGKNSGASVHLQMWPEVQENLLHEEVLVQMQNARNIVELGLSGRSEAKIRVRQPLQYVLYTGANLGKDLELIIADELNVKEVKWQDSFEASTLLVVKEEKNIRVGISLEITEELQKEGLFRELVRGINQMRKNANLTIEDTVQVEFETDDQMIKDVIYKYMIELKKSVLASEIQEGKGSEEVKIGEQSVFLTVTKQ